MSDDTNTDWDDTSAAETAAAAEYPDKALINSDGYLGWHIQPNGELAAGPTVPEPDDPAHKQIWEHARARYLGQT